MKTHMKKQLVSIELLDWFRIQWAQNGDKARVMKRLLNLDRRRVAYVSAELALFFEPEQLDEFYEMLEHYRVGSL